MTRPERQESVEVLRGIAAFAVMWYHLTNGNPAFLPPSSLLKMSGTYGYLGVQLFFVISGFIIPYSLALRNYEPQTDGLGFLARRIVRIEPPYLVSAVVVVLLQTASALTPGSHAPIPASGLLASLALHFAYLVPWFDMPWLLPVYWSLAIEFQYYIAILFFAPLLISGERVRITIFLIGTAALSLACGDPRTVFPYLPLFGLGFVRYLAVQRALRPWELAAWFAVFFGLCWFVRAPSEAITGAAAFAFLSLPLKGRLPALSFLGAISYSLYLIHVPIGGRIINLAMRLPATLPVQLVALFVAVVASLLAAFCYWRLIENPSARLSKGMSSKGLRLTCSRSAHDS